MGLKQRIMRLWDRIRLVLVAALTALVLLFALQNLQTVQIDIVLWEIGASASLLVLGSFLVGLLVGGLATLYYKGRFWSEREGRTRALADKAAAEEKATAARLPRRRLPRSRRPKSRQLPSPGSRLQAERKRSPQDYTNRVQYTGGRLADTRAHVSP